MFAIDEKTSEFPVPPEKVVSVFQSINEPKISAQDRPVEPTQAYVVMNSNQDKLEASIILFLTQSRGMVVYRWQEGAFNKKKRPDVESEALDFVEGMGFMMDNLGVEKLKEEDRVRLLEELPIFVLEPEVEAELDADFAAEVAEIALENPELVLNEDLVETRIDFKEMSKVGQVVEPTTNSSAELDTLLLSDDEFQRSEKEIQGDENEYEDLSSIGAMLDEESDPVEAPLPDVVAMEQRKKSVETPSNLTTLLRLMASF